MRHDTPALSVVMPSLNQRPYLGAAVRSVMAQDIDGLELVVMDGGSDDGSIDELAALGAEHPGRVRWFSAPDGGPAQAINRAVHEARGPVVGWLNSDDIYTPGAARRALDHLAAHPDHTMVYGHGEHVDMAGTLIQRYPTLLPSTPLSAFADGCFICQPTAFFRREAFLALGGLDTTLRTAFDFDLWLRFFKAYSAGIGFVDAVQAQSRLHAAGITLRMRSQVALEGLAVIHRHLGGAPSHWLATHFEELLAQHPFHAQPKELREEFAALLRSASRWVPSAGLLELEERIAADRRLQLSTPSLGASVYADGWAGPRLDLRLWQPERPVRAIVLQCEHAAPGGGWLRMRIASPDGTEQTVEVRGNGLFEMVIDVPDVRPQARALFRITSDTCFVPAELDRGSADNRALAFRMVGCQLVPAAS